MSIAGGYYKAVRTAHECKCDCVQLFTKNNNQWRAKPITDEDVQLFRDAIKEHRISHPVSHSSYLLNLASPDDELWKKSIDGFVVELQRAELLGIPFVVIHPGSYTTSSETAGIKRIIRALNDVHRQTSGATQCLLETTAGQGSNLGWRFEHLADMIDGVREPDRVGICLDTCHIFAAGYPLGTERDYRATMAALNKTVGIKKVKAIHLNDSKRELGARVDRHDHIGRGKMGLAPFRFLLNDRRFHRIPMYLETPKGQENGVELDVINLRRLRRLVRKEK
jgi:deoxyribonuclease-4